MILTKIFTQISMKLLLKMVIEFLKKLYEYGFVVIQNCKTEMSSVEIIAKKIGYVRNQFLEDYGVLSPMRIKLTVLTPKKS